VVETSEKKLVRLLEERGLTVSAAESCTGGMVAERITSVPGASRVLRFSAVTYCNEAKEKVLGVRRETLDAYGAVSARTAHEMASGVRKILGADLGVSVTGLAGPDGGEGKPVGLVYVGADADWGNLTREYHFSGDRDAVRRQAAEEALCLAAELVGRRSKEGPAENSAAAFEVEETTQ